jgi:hypothetical protein
MKLNVVPFVLACLFSGAARADFYLVVHAGNAQAALTQKEAVDLFMGRQRTFPRGDFALVFDLPRDSPQREAFYKALTGMSLAQVNSYWARLMFAGQSLPPQPLPDEAAMLDIVRRNPSALGWVSKEPNDKNIRTVLVLKESP